MKFRTKENNCNGIIVKKTYPILFAIILTFVFSINGIAQKERYVTPVDEGKNDASFNEFREKLIAAVKNATLNFCSTRSTVT
jgi:hypothetical protein